MTEIICSGFGGQGVLTIGMILINMGVDAGKQVLWSPSYGSEMRGGTANCNVIISDEEIGSPLVTYPDVLLAMNEPSLVKFQDKVKKGGVILVNQSILSDNWQFPEGIDVYAIDATSISNEMGNPKGANIVMLGAIAKVGKLFSIEQATFSLDKYFSKKGKFPLNEACLDAGYNKVYKV